MSEERQAAAEEEGQGEGGAEGAAGEASQGGSEEGEGGGEAVGSKEEAVIDLGTCSSSLHQDPQYLQVRALGGRW